MSKNDFISGILENVFFLEDIRRDNIREFEEMAIKELEAELKKLEQKQG